MILDIDGSAATGDDHRISPATAATSGLVFDPTTSDVDDTANTITFASPHGLSNGDALVYSSGGVTPPDGLLNGVTYYADVQSATSIKLRERLLFNAVDSASEQDIDTANNWITLDDTVGGHGLSVGDTVVYRNASSGTVGGLTPDATYYVVDVSDAKVKLSTTANGSPIQLSYVLVGLNQHSYVEALHSLEKVVNFDASVALSGEHRLTLAETDSSDLAPGALVIKATGSDANRAEAIAGQGFSLIATFAAATAKTNTNSTTSATIGQNTGSNVIRAGSVNVSADHMSELNHVVDGTAIALFGTGSYPTGTAKVNADVNASVGDGVDLVTGRHRSLFDQPRP